MEFFFFDIRNCVSFWAYLRVIVKNDKYDGKEGNKEVCVK